MKKTVHTVAQLALRRGLVKARKSAELTQQELAKHLGKPQSFVAKYETGERRLDVVEFLRVMRAIGTREQPLLHSVKRVLDS